VAAHPPLERAKSESKGSRESRPVRIKLDSPQPSLSAADDEYVSIKVKIDPDKEDTRVNLEEKKFLKITDLTYNGPLVTKVRRTLDLDLFVPQGFTGREHTFTRFGYFERLLTGNAKDKFCKTYKLASVMMLVKWEIDKDDLFKILSAN
jgi:hypothetical protein